MKNNKIGEKDLIKLATILIVRNGRANVKEIRHEVYRLIRIQQPDLEPLKNREYDQKWKQIVRNLVSNRTLERYGYAYYDKSTGNYVAAPLGYAMTNNWLRNGYGF